MLSKFKMLVFLFLLLTAAWLLMQPLPLPVRAAGPIYVDTSAPGPTHDGAAWATAYPTMQDALAVAVSGDEIWVAAGVYYPDEGAGQTANDRVATFTLKNGVALYGGFAGTESSRDARDWQANPTILSGDIDQNDTHGGDYINENVSQIVVSNAYHVVTGGGTDNTAVLDGFVITAGQANGSSPNDSGGGMYNNNSSPTLTHVTFSGNTADDGGGMYNRASSPVLTDVTFRGNTATYYGGGMDNQTSSPTLTNVSFSGNSADYGGGGMDNNNSSPAMTDVTFSGNTATSYGGGMYNQASSPAMTDVTFSGNTTTDYGGGMSNQTSSPTLTNVSFSGNSAGYGGGMSNWSGSNPTLANVTFGGNSADYGGGMENDASSPTLTNVILWGNNASNGPEIYNDSSTPTISYSIVQNGCPAGSTCSHLLIADPLFVDAANGNLRLQPTSPAIDAGNNAAVPSGVTTDLDGNPRFVDITTAPDIGNGTPPLVDMGAYEVQYTIFLPLVLINMP